MSRAMYMAAALVAIALIGGGFAWYTASKPSSPSTASHSVSQTASAKSDRAPASIPAFNKVSTQNQTFVNTTVAPSESTRDESYRRDLEYRTRRDELIDKRWGKINKLRDPLHPIKFTSNSHEYEFLPNTWAVPRSKYVAGKGNPPVDQAWGYVILQTAPGETPPNGAVPAAVSPVEKSVVVVTGAVSVKFNSPGLAETFGQEFNLSLVNSLDEINIAYYQGSDNSAADLTNLVDNLRRDPRVARANLQIVNRKYVTK